MEHLKMSIRNTDRYLSAVLDEFRDDCIEGFANEYEAKKSLWHTAVVVFEVADDPEPWLDELRDIALDAWERGHYRPRQIEGTINSARRRAS
jgi:hypothetical protein